MRLMARPFRGYRELAREPEAPSALVGFARFMFVIGVLVATTATGSFAPVELASAMVAFSWLPLSQVVGLAVTLRAVKREVPLRRALGLYLESLGPWMLVFLALSGSCLFAAQPAKVVFRVLAPLFLMASVWSVLLVYALFREAFGLGRKRAASAVVLFYVVVHAVVLGYYLLAGQLWPIL